MIKKIVGAIIILISILFVIPWRYSSSVMGTILDVLCHQIIRYTNNSTNFDNKCSYLIRYKVNNNEYTTSHTEMTNWFGTNKMKGESIEVFYKPDSPQDGMVNKAPRTIGGFLLIIFGIILLFV